MKKFIKKFIIVMLPLMLHIFIFVIFEPYNYYGLKDQFSGDWSKPLARVRTYMRNPSENIILGDSRMNHLDTDLIEEMAGKRYVNLSTGGQCLNLTYELFEWANAQKKVENLVLDVSFYQLREGTRNPSAENVFYIAEHPLEYPFALDYVKEAWREMRNVFVKEDKKDVLYSKEVEEKLEQNKKYREDLVVYAVGSIYPVCQNYTIGDEQEDFLLNVIQETKKNNGDVKILIPCVQESIWEYVIEPLEIERYMNYYKKELSNYATIYDMEWKSDISLQQDIWADGFHFISSDVYNDIYAVQLFGENNDRIY